MEIDTELYRRATKTQLLKYLDAARGPSLRPVRAAIHAEFVLRAQHRKLHPKHPPTNLGEDEKRERDRRIAASEERYRDNRPVPLKGKKLKDWRGSKSIKRMLRKQRKKDQQRTPLTDEKAAARRAVRRTKRQMLKKQLTTEYEAYLRSPAWKAKREEVFLVYGRLCSVCGSTKYLQVHHKTYKRIFKEHIDDLQVLCKTCHALEHDRPNQPAVTSVSTQED